jgi:hypothetical protein
MLDLTLVSWRASCSHIETPDDVKVFASDPSDGQRNLIDHGWNVMVRNAGTQGRQTTAVAICADGR